MLRLAVWKCSDVSLWPMKVTSNHASSEQTSAKNAPKPTTMPYPTPCELDYYCELTKLGSNKVDLLSQCTGT